MMKSSMAFTTKANEIFMIMRCFRNQITANLYFVMGLKLPAVFYFRFTTMLATSFGFPPSSVPSIPPPDMVISNFPASPTWAVRTVAHSVFAFTTALVMSVTYTPTNRTCAFFVVVPSYLFFVFLHSCPLALDISVTIKASCCSRSNQYVTINATFINMFPPLNMSLIHICILAHFFRKSNYRQAPSNRRD